MNNADFTPPPTPRPLPMLQTFRKRVMAGLIIAIPALVTFWVIEITLEVAVASGEPLARLLASFVSPFSPEASELLLSDSLRWIVAIGLMIGLLYGLGMMAARLSGRQIVEGLERRVLEIP